MLGCSGHQGWFMKLKWLLLLEGYIIYVPGWIKMIKTTKVSAKGRFWYDLITALPLGHTFTAAVLSSHSDSLGPASGERQSWYLFVGLEHFLFFHILRIIIPTDHIIFFRGVQTTNQVPIEDQLLVPVIISQTFLHFAKSHWGATSWRRRLRCLQGAAQVWEIPMFCWFPSA